jgi:predicted Zn-ribbon and HTH transcriptional regulator
MTKNKCPKCGSEMNWLRRNIFKAKINYCSTCGYNFKRTLTGKIKTDVLYAICKSTFYKESIIFVRKYDYDVFSHYHDGEEIVPLINSTNIKKDEESNR